MSSSGAPSSGGVTTVTSVKDPHYGAKGDGVTDDTAAINACIAAVGAAGGGTVFWPPGTYMVTGIDVGYSNVLLQGSGMGATVLKRIAAVGNIDTRVIGINQPIGGALSTAVGAYLNNVTVQDMTLDGNNANVSSTKNSTFVQGTLQAFQVKNFKATRVYVVNPRDIGICVFGCIYGDVVDCTVDGMAGDFQVNSIMVVGDAYQGDPGFAVNQRPSRFIRVRGCRVIRNWWLQGDQLSGYFTGSGMGVNVQGSEDVQVVDCDIDFTGEPAARGRNGSGIIFEAGGSAAAFGLLRRCVAAGNRVRYANNAIAALTTSGGANDVTGNIIGVTFTGNIVDDSVIGLFACGSRVSMTGNIVQAGRAIRLGNNDSSKEENFTITGNTVRIVPNSQLYGISGNKSTAGGYLKGLVIADNVIDGQDITDLAVNVSGITLTGEFTGFIIGHNVVRNIPTNGIRLDSVSGADNAQPRPRDGRIVGNELVNVVNQAGATYPQYYAICSTGTDNVLCMLNKIIGSGAGIGSYRDTASENTGVLTIFGNLTAANAVASDRGSASNRLGGTVTGSKAANAALASLMTALVNVQLVKDTTT